MLGTPMRSTATDDEFAGRVRTMALTRDEIHFPNVRIAWERLMLLDAVLTAPNWTVS